MHFVRLNSPFSRESRRPLFLKVLFAIKGRPESIGDVLVVLYAIKLDTSLPEALP
ncbi:hypothetical protein GCM10010913_26320 [Paenibacillus aceti]|uniref:Uncharacterized protein n=1 Tax=Paenibacillus aceti TaxID=1820010 RepID=A0ABQ1VZ46_9BACL|nr:hypothetical protein GCM10010913_26320 [Paenibacillus aceti]